MPEHAWVLIANPSLQQIILSHRLAALPHKVHFVALEIFAPNVESCEEFLGFELEVQ